MLIFHKLLKELKKKEIASKARVDKAKVKLDNQKKEFEKAWNNSGK